MHQCEAIIFPFKLKPHLRVTGILSGHQVQNWLDIGHLMRKKLHENFIASDLTRNKQTTCRISEFAA